MLVLSMISTLHDISKDQCPLKPILVKNTVSQDLISARLVGFPLLLPKTNLPKLIVETVSVIF